MLLKFILCVKISQVLEVIQLSPQALPPGWTVNHWVSGVGTSCSIWWGVGNHATSHGEADPGTEPVVGAIVEVGAQAQVVIVDDILGGKIGGVGQDGGTVSQLAGWVEAGAGPGEENPGQN